MIWRTRPSRPPQGGSHRGIAAGLAFAAAEATQSIALLPLIHQRIGAHGAAAWVVFSASSALVGLAGTAYFQPLVRSIVAHQLPGGPAFLPANWLVLRRRLAGRCSLLLALLQAAFVLCLPGRTEHLANLGVSVLAMLFAAQQLRLLALGLFTAYNGICWLGEDKLQMARVSLLSLLASAALLLLGGGLVGLALIQLVSQGLLVVTAVAGVRRVALHPLAEVALAPRGQAAALLCLGLAGYLNMGTDTMLAGGWLAPSALVDYGILSRTLALAPAAMGLWAHVRFPAWCAQDTEPHVLYRDLGRALATLSAGLLVVTGLFLAWRGQRQAGLSSTLILVAGVNMLMASSVIMLGQMLLARGSHGFVWPSTALAAVAPLLAELVARHEGDGSFMFGYLVCNMMLLGLQLACFVRMSSRMRQSP